MKKSSVKPEHIAISFVSRHYMCSGIYTCMEKVVGVGVLESPTHWSDTCAFNMYVESTGVACITNWTCGVS